MGKLGRSDKIAALGVIIALLGLVIAIIAIIGPIIGHQINIHRRPQVLITGPTNGQSEQNNAFGASGVAKNIPAGDHLWLVVQSDVYYPFDTLKVTNDGWNVPAYGICTSSGTNYIEIYLVPATADGSLFQYRDNGSKNHLTGIPSMPPGAILEAWSRVDVADDILC